MKLFLLVTWLALVSARGIYEPINNRYHETVGIPLYERLKQVESAQDFDGSRIIGGQQASLGAHPHVAGLIVTLNAGFSLCGASLVSNTRLVTAAHCWTDSTNQGRSMLVVLGSLTVTSGGHRVTATNVQVHGNYDSRTLNNDVAVITIPWVAYSNNIRNIALPSGLFLYFTYAGEVAVAVGYGRSVDRDISNDPNNNRLRQTNLMVIENFECANVYSPTNVISSTLCTSGLGGVGICDGDSGGPLAYTFSGVRYLIGISSFAAGSGCSASLPSGYARVSSFASWISARL